MFAKQLNRKLDKYHLLKHPFYKSWNEGKLTREIIKDYAEQYYQHVKAFPRYISATHSLCEDLEKRKILLENLQDEEKDGADHPKLWKDFALAIGADGKKIDGPRALSHPHQIDIREQTEEPNDKERVRYTAGHRRNIESQRQWNTIGNARPTCDPCHPLHPTHFEPDEAAKRRASVDVGSARDLKTTTHLGKAEGD